MAVKAEKPKPHDQTTFQQAYDAFKTLHVAQKRENTRDSYLRMIDGYYLPQFKLRPLDSITHRQIAAITDDLVDRPGECRHVIAVGRMFFKFCVRRRYISASPIDGMQLPKHTPRDRVLTEAEIKAIWNATGDGKIFSNIVRLLLVTGQRRGEIAQLQTPWIKQNEIVFPKEVTKNGRQHALPIGPLAQKLLSTTLQLMATSSFVLFPSRGSTTTPFNGWMKSKLALDKKLGPDFAPWTLHDCRRTFATNMAKLGVRLEVTEKLLNHVSGSTGGIVGVYMKYNFESEMRDAVARWEAKLAAIVA